MVTDEHHFSYWWCWKQIFITERGGDAIFRHSHVLYVESIVLRAQAVIVIVMDWNPNVKAHWQSTWLLPTLNEGSFLSLYLIHNVKIFYVWYLGEILDDTEWGDSYQIYFTFADWFEWLSIFCGFFIKKRWWRRMKEGPVLLKWSNNDWFHPDRQLHVSESLLRHELSSNF